MTPAFPTTSKKHRSRIAEARETACRADECEQRVREILDTVEDPEIPGVAITDLGIVRYVREADSSTVVVGLTPTYTGCPATEVIAARVRDALRAGGIEVRIETVLHPPWSSDDITPRGRRRLQAQAIAPPPQAAAHPRTALGPRDGVPCPRCASTRTRLTSEFGSTPCKALYRCDACLEPFECFKCL